MGCEVDKVAIFNLKTQKVRGRIDRDKEKGALPESDNVLTYLFCDVLDLKAFQVL